MSDYEPRMSRGVITGLRADLGDAIPAEVWSGLESMRKIAADSAFTHNERCFAWRYVDDVAAVLIAMRNSAPR